MMIIAQKVEEQSTFGAGDALTIFLWHETPTGYAYEPVAQVGYNPGSQSFRKRLFAGTPAGQNFQLLKKDNLPLAAYQIQIARFQNRNFPNHKLGHRVDQSGQNP